MDMSYRLVWELVKDMNDDAGTPLVEVSTVGAGGGGAVLTADDLNAMRVYKRILESMERFTLDIDLQLSDEN